MISRIIKVEVRVVSSRLRLITFTRTLLILDITKTESNGCIIYLFPPQRPLSFCFDRRVGRGKTEARGEWSIPARPPTRNIIPFPIGNLCGGERLYNEKKLKSCFCFFTEGNTKRANLTWLPVTLSVKVGAVARCRLMVTRFLAYAYFYNFHLHKGLMSGRKGKVSFECTSTAEN